MTNLETRLTQEICKLEAKNFTVIRKSTRDLEIILDGPPESPFSTGKFIVKIHIPDDYPFKSPSIGFATRIFHPNIDENSGTVCLDVLNQVWSPLYELINVLEIFLPQLLTYPNAMDPLNTEAAQLYINDMGKYENMVKEYIRKYGYQKVKEEEEESEQMESDDVDL